MPVAGLPVWRQAVDRRGKDIKRVGISTKRKDNFHQVRMYMLNLLSIERMIKNRGRMPSHAENLQSNTRRDQARSFAS